jgi:hypothetical protein
MAKGRKTLAGSSNQKPIEQYNHADKERLLISTEKYTSSSVQKYTIFN